MTAKEVGGQGRTATINGTADNNTGWLTANIQGANVKCQGVKVPGSCRTEVEARRTTRFRRREWLSNRLVEGHSRCLPATVRGRQS